MLGRLRITVAAAADRFSAMSVPTAATVSAIAATALATAGHAAHPALVVLAVAAGCSFLAALRSLHRPSPTDWLTVRLLLATNLAVYGIVDTDPLGTPAAAFAIASGALLAGSAIYTYATRSRRRRTGR